MPAHRDRPRGGIPGADWAGSVIADGHRQHDISTTATVVHLHRESWHVPMVLAYRIGRTPPPWKVQAVKCWAVATVAALGVEVRQ